MMAPAAMPPTMPAPTAQPTQRASAVPGAATETRASALALATTVRNLVMVLVPRFEFQHHTAPPAQPFQGGAPGRAGKDPLPVLAKGESARRPPHPWGMDPAITRVTPGGEDGVLPEPIALIGNRRITHGHATQDRHQHCPRGATDGRQG